MESKEIYKNKVLKEELERLKRAEYSNYVSFELLKNIELKDKTFLDIGSGPNSNLGEFIIKKGANYIPLDIKEFFLKEIKNEFDKVNFPFWGVIANAISLPFKDKSIDISHQRFVLMNVNPNIVQYVLNEIFRVSKSHIFLIEYNWRNFGSKQYSEITDEIMKIALDIFSQIKVDCYFGEKLKILVQNYIDNNKLNIFDIQINNFVREESSNYNKDLILVLKNLKSVAINVLKDSSLGSKIDNLIDFIQSNLYNFIFSPPEVVSVRIDLK